MNVSRFGGQGEFGGCGGDVCVEVCEGPGERSWWGGVCGEDSGEGWAEQAVVGAAEEQRSAEAGLGDAV